jgi:DNA-binding response OmpR family regulator
MTDEQKIIIVVDDNNANLVACKNILKPHFVVYPVPSAAKMFELMEHIKPDMILLDIEMPEMNGYDAARKLKSSDSYKDIPLLFLSARNDTASEMEGLNIGALDYIIKPFFSDLLLKRINLHLSIIKYEKKIEELQDKANENAWLFLSLIGEMHRANADKPKVSCKEIDLKKMLDRLTDTIKPVVTENHQNITVNIDKETPLIIYSDELKLFKVLINMLLNASELSGENGNITFNVKQEDATETGTAIKFEVIDSATGTPNVKQNDIGGIDLDTLKDLAELINGRIEVKPESGKSSKSIFLLNTKK